MKKLLTALQWLSGFLIYGCVGAADNGYNFGATIRNIFILLLAILVLQGAKTMQKCRMQECRNCRVNSRIKLSQKNTSIVKCDFAECDKRILGMRHS